MPDVGTFIPNPLFPFTWEQGEHMVIIGSTGTGKTTLASQILRARKYVLSIVTKKDSSNLLLPNDVPRNRHLKTVDDIGTDPRRTHFVIDPPMDKQREEALKVYRRAWKDGAWCVFTDELFYVEQELGLGKINRTLLTQGRSKGISMVNGIQRPAWVSRFAISEPTHVICSRMEGRDLLSVVQATSPQLKLPLMNLARYQFVWYYRPENTYAVVDLATLQGKGRPERTLGTPLAR